MPALQKNPALEALAGPVPAAGGTRSAEHLVLLAHDESLIEALVSVVPGESLTVVADDAQLASQLLGGQVGVVFLDAGAAQSPGAAAQLAQRLHAQLPEVVLVVAGDGAAQSELAALVADGTIYRFVHKPVSAQRVKLFVDAAWRKRDGSSASGVYPALSMPPLPPPPPAVAARGVARPAAVVGGALVAGATLAWLLLRANTPAGSAAGPPPAALPAAPTAPLPLPDTRSAATAAAAAAAADLDRLATAAEAALLAGDLAAAARLTDAARAVDPEHVRVKFLTAQLAREQTRAAARRRAAELAATAAATPSPAPAASEPAPAASLPTPAAAVAPEPLPVVAAGAITASDATVAPAPASAGPPSSTPPVSEARDPNSVAAVILQRVSAVDPVFPEIARERDLSGFVDLEFAVRADGTVTDVNVLKAQPVGVFEKAAVEAVSKWRYRPIERNGQPVTEHARLRLNFAYK